MSGERKREEEKKRGEEEIAKPCLLAVMFSMVAPGCC
jgi:hypothetical protein